MATNLSGPPKLNSPAPVNENVTNEVMILSEQTVPILVKGLIADSQHLVWQQLAMIWQEIRDDFHQNKKPVVALAMALGIIGAGSCLLLLTLPLLLNWAVPALPLWACFAISGGVLNALGGVVLYVGVKSIKSFNLLSNQAVEAFKENLSWKTKPT